VSAGAVALLEPMAQREGRTIDARGAASPATSGRLEDGKVQGGSPLCKPKFIFDLHVCCRSGFSRELCVIEDGGSGLKPLLQRPFFVGTAFAVTVAPSKADHSGA
jgi:hypothetical protein